MNMIIITPHDDFLHIGNYNFLVFLALCASTAYCTTSDSAVTSNPAYEIPVTRTVTQVIAVKAPVTITDTINGRVIMRTVSDGGGMSTDIPVAVTNSVNDQAAAETVT